MGFSESVKSVFGKYATFSGRATRSEYWYFTLFNFLLNIGAMIVCCIIGAIASGVEGLAVGYAVWYGICCLYSLATLIPGLAVGARRLHDTGRSGWNLLWALLPLIGPIILLIFFVTESQGDNQYGERPE